MNALYFRKTLDQFNHGPAHLFLHTGSPQFGRPSMGAWVSYGLGSANRNLPSFVVLVSGPANPDGGAVPGALRVCWICHGSVLPAF